MTDTNNPDIKIDFAQPLKNKRHEKFSNLYVTSPFEIGVIYTEAGYKGATYESNRTNAYKVLRKDTVKGRIKYLSEQRNERLGLDGDNVIRGLYMMRDRCAGGQLVVDRQGNPITVFVDVGTGNREMCVVWKSDVAGFNRASELLAKYHGLLTEKVDVNVNKVREEQIEATADDILAGLQTSKEMRNQLRIAKKSKDDKLIEYPVDESDKVDETPYESPRVHTNDDGEPVKA